MNLFYLENSGEILFKLLFGNSLIKQSLLFHHQQKPDEPIILDLPELLSQRVKQTILNDGDLSPLNIRYGKSGEIDVSSSLNVVVRSQVGDASGGPPPRGIYEHGGGNERQDPPVTKGLPLNRIFYDANNDVDVYSLEDLAKLRCLMKQQILKTTSTFVARAINKPISLPFSHLLAMRNIKPNTITLVALLFSLLGAFFLLDPQLFLYGFIFFQVNSILDGCDGEVARLNLKTTRLGKKLDVFADYITSLLLMEAGAVGILKLHSESWLGHLAYPIALIPLITAGLWLVVWRFKLTPRELDDIEGACHQKLACPQNVLEKIMAGFLWISRRDFYIFLLFIAALLQQYLLIPIFMVLVAISWLVLSFYSVKLVRP